MKKIWIFLICFFVIIIAVLSLYYFKSPINITTAKYTNTESGYSFDYPRKYKISCVIGDKFAQPSDPAARIVDVTLVLGDQINSLFRVTAIGNFELSSENIVNMLSAPASKEVISTTNVKIGGIDGFKVSIEPKNENNTTHTSYYVHGSKGNLQIEGLNTAESKDILASFKFNN